MSSKLGVIAAGEAIITGGAEVVATTMVGGIIAATDDLTTGYSDEAASIGGLIREFAPLKQRPQPGEADAD